MNNMINELKKEGSDVLSVKGAGKYGVHIPADHIKLDIQTILDTCYSTFLRKNHKWKCPICNKVSKTKDECGCRTLRQDTRNVEDSRDTSHDNCKKRGEHKNKNKKGKNITNSKYGHVLVDIHLYNKIISGIESPHLQDEKLTEYLDSRLSNSDKDRLVSKNSIKRYIIDYVNENNALPTHFNNNKLSYSYGFSSTAMFDEFKKASYRK